MNCFNKSWIAQHEMECQENLASLIEIIAQFQGYHDRAQFKGKQEVTIEINNWQLQIGALLNITASIAGSLKVSGQMLKLVSLNENLREALSEAQIEQISAQLMNQLKSK